MRLRGLISLGVLCSLSALAQSARVDGAVAAAAFAAEVPAGGPEQSVRFVSQNGNDTADGKNWGSAKASVAAALSSLPSMVVRGQNYPAGTLQLGGGVYSLTSTLKASMNFVRVVGQGRYATTVNCTAAVCFSWDNSAGTGGDPAEGGLYNLTLNGNGSAHQVGISTVDGNGLHLVGVKIAGFDGDGAIGWRGTNSTSETERTVLIDTWFHNNSASISFTGTAVHNSFMHNTWLGVQFNLARPEQVAIALGPHALFQANVVTGVINNDNRHGDTYAWSIDTGPGVGGDTFLALFVDNNGGGNVVGVNFTSGKPAFQPWGTFAGYTTPTMGTGNFATQLPSLQGSQYRVIQGGVGSGGAAYAFGAFQARRDIPGCSTRSSQGARCTTTVSWPRAFADTDYTAVCNGTEIASGAPADAGVTNKRPGSVDVVTVAVTSDSARFATIDCVAHHDP